MPRTTFPSSPLSLSTSPQPGPHTTLTSSCWSSCSQASAHTQSNKRFTLCNHFIFHANETHRLLYSCWVLTDRIPPFPYSWSLLLFQQPLRRQDLHHHVWSYQHVLLSCHGTSCTAPHMCLKRLFREPLIVCCWGLCH